MARAAALPPGPQLHSAADKRSAACLQGPAVHPCPSLAQHPPQPHLDGGIEHDHQILPSALARINGLAVRRRRARHQAARPAVREIHLGRLLKAAVASDAKLARASAAGHGCRAQACGERGSTLAWSGGGGGGWAAAAAGELRRGCRRGLLANRSCVHWGSPLTRWGCPGCPAVRQPRPWVAGLRRMRSIPTGDAGRACRTAWSSKHAGFRRVTARPSSCKHQQSDRRLSGALPRAGFVIQ